MASLSLALITNPALLLLSDSFQTCRAMRASKRSTLTRANHPCATANSTWPIKKSFSKRVSIFPSLCSHAWADRATRASTSSAWSQPKSTFSSQRSMTTTTSTAAWSLMWSCRQMSSHGWRSREGSLRRSMIRRLPSYDPQVLMLKIGLQLEACYLTLFWWQPRKRIPRN